MRLRDRSCNRTRLSSCSRRRSNDNVYNVIFFEKNYGLSNRIDYSTKINKLPAQSLSKHPHSIRIDFSRLQQLNEL
jgi:hypothetical protein